CSSVCSAAPGALEPVVRGSVSTSATGVLRLLSDMDRFRLEDAAKMAWEDRLPRPGEIFHRPVRRFVVACRASPGQERYAAGALAEANVASSQWRKSAAYVRAHARQ